jgi:aromatic ring hydroxylase
MCEVEEMKGEPPDAHELREADRVVAALAAAGWVIRPAVDDDTQREVRELVGYLRATLWATPTDRVRAADLLSRYLLGEATDGE